MPSARDLTQPAVSSLDTTLSSILLIDGKLDERRERKYHGLLIRLQDQNARNSMTSDVNNRLFTQARVRKLVLAIANTLSSIVLSSVAPKVWETQLASLDTEGTIPALLDWIKALQIRVDLGKPNSRGYNKAVAYIFVRLGNVHRRTRVTIETDGKVTDVDDRDRIVEREIHLVHRCGSPGILLG